MAGRNFSNETHDEHQAEFAGDFDARYHIPPIAVAVVIIGLNGWVLYLVKTKPNLQSSMNFLLCSLALSDLLTGSLSIPLHVCCDVTWKTNICVASQLFMRFTSVSTVMHLLAITMDRYLGIKHALRYNALVTKNRVIVTSVFIWSSSIFASLIQLAWINYGRDDVDEEDEDLTKHEIRYDVTNLVLYVVIPFVVMTIVYVTIFFEILRHYRNIKQYNSPGWAETKKRTHHEWKAVAIFSIMLFVFIVCWLPFFTIRLQYNLGKKLFELPHSTEYVFVYLRFFTSFFNPFMYIFGKRDFRQAINFSRRSLFTRFHSSSYHSSMKTTTV
ncbi:alpha-2Db adrenergic receptor-like [Stylophora pistillata]|uniref:alpha-2Db adrenergic receptor-like n=1 Tax=Stylophora pistillata TaxID=50429 RepID=UPI000C04366E|nr:alpha-2Db adrenergic receptor-like [Stylophora pistillata]XP_022792416.1 alpha-2Db adrenergic receptor-like [Stylophora pistillata]XP_022792417.1 alpha-2Db adrenergic receptor-like [Stylophora pistillata]